MAPLGAQPPMTSRVTTLVSLCALVGGSAAVAIMGTGVAAAAPDGSLDGKIVFIDPGHQGSSDPAKLGKQVDDGRGGEKDCQTTGATSINGVAEHTINWDIAQLLKAGLEEQGATVVLSRDDDTGFGGCIDERAAAANESGADVAISLHADSTSLEEDDANSGFHLIIPELPVPNDTVTEVQGGEGLKATKAVRDALEDAGQSAANYAGVKDGLQTRDDIAGPALTEVPLVFLEMGNLSNPDDAARLESDAGQLDEATAILDGLNRYLDPDAAIAAKKVVPIAKPVTVAKPGKLEPVDPSDPADPAAADDDESVPASELPIDLSDLDLSGLDPENLDLSGLDLGQDGLTEEQLAALSDLDLSALGIDTEALGLDQDQIAEIAQKILSGEVTVPVVVDGPDEPGTTPGTTVSPLGERPLIEVIEQFQPVFEKVLSSPEGQELLGEAIGSDAGSTVLGQVLGNPESAAVLAAMLSQLTKSS